ncbi:MAG: YebC/PmpR family DNA-binding transcriptional regulator [Fimbriimonadales bacterium]|nr:YebC/PmpR family DNA-binding transcriptional regulator [Fimbriimonadales bacterium]
MAGHSKWANIRIRKGKQDALRGNLFTKLSREIIVAAKLGGPDPEGNSRLRAAIAKAKLNRMPNDTIKKAIEKATGGGEGSNLEEVTYEGYGPGGTAIMVKCLTDNRNRTVPELRHAFSKHGGNLAENGSVSWQFKQQGEIMIPTEGVDEESLTLAALDAGAKDVSQDNGYFTVVTAVESFHKVRDALESSGFTIEEADLAMNPTNKVDISQSDSESLIKLLEKLDELDDVQETYFNADLPEEN